jgi:hypothetical protein
LDCVPGERWGYDVLDAVLLGVHVPKVVGKVGGPYHRWRSFTEGGGGSAAVRLAVLDGRADQQRAGVDARLAQRGVQHVDVAAEARQCDAAGGQLRDRVPRRRAHGEQQPAAASLPHGGQNPPDQGDRGGQVLVDPAAPRRNPAVRCLTEALDSGVFGHGRPHEHLACLREFRRRCDPTGPSATTS